jgi:hypothetical protein
MLLIFPPAAKPGEPPAGIAKLAAALDAHGLSCTVLDANIEGLRYLMQKPPTALDTWTRRAVKNSSSNLAALRDPRTYRFPDRYRRAVKDVNRVLEASAGEFHAILGLADYHHQQLSPVRSDDLIIAAEHPEQNPFYPYFNVRLPEILDKTVLIPTTEPFGGKLQRGEGPSTLVRADNGRTAGVVGISLNYLSQALTTFALIGYLRREFPGLKIVLGGGLVTSWMKGPAWRNPFNGLVDHLIAGPGEGPLLELLGIKEIGHEHVTPDYGALPSEAYLSPGFLSADRADAIGTNAPSARKQRRTIPMSRFPRNWR